MTGGLDDLRREFDGPHGVGGVTWTAEVLRSCRAITPNYSPEVYSEGLSWESGMDDLVQDVRADSLLRDGQGQYLLDVAIDMADFRALLNRQVRRVLARRRRRTVVDRLLTRCRKILSSEDFVATMVGTEVRWHLASLSRQDRNPTPVELRRAAEGVRLIPTVASDVHDRAPTVYRSEDLRRVLEAIARALPTTFSIRDLDRILHQTLTQYVSVILERGTPPGGVPRSLSSEQEFDVKQAVDGAVDALLENEKAVLAGKLAAVSDGEIAVALSISRPTAAKIKQSAHNRITPFFAPLPDQCRTEAATQLSSRLVPYWPPQQG